MQKLIDAREGRLQARRAADWEFYAEQVRKAEYDLDEAQIKPYFELDRVLQDGVFFAANKLYGITFKERTDLPVYQPDVRVFEVFDADGKSAGALLRRLLPARTARAAARGCDSFVDQSRPARHEAGRRQRAQLHEARARASRRCSPSTTSTTMFHEFGHALHGMFSNVKYPTLGERRRATSSSSRRSSTSTGRSSRRCSRTTRSTTRPARRCRTALVEKIKKAKTFNQGYVTTEYLAAALLDMAWHTLPPDAPKQDVDAFEKAALERFKRRPAAGPAALPHDLLLAHLGRRLLGRLLRVPVGEVLDDDACYWFKEHGGMTRENGQRFRDMILSRGGTEDVAAMYRAFRGRDPIVEPLLEERGLAATTKP